MMTVVDYKKLADILGISARTMQKSWRNFPHFFAGSGKTLKSARFELSIVMEHIRNVSLEGQEDGALASEVPAGHGISREERLQKQGRRQEMGSRGKGEAQESGTYDRFNILRDVGGQIPRRLPRQNGKKHVEG